MTNNYNKAESLDTLLQYFPDWNQQKELLNNISIPNLINRGDLLNDLNAKIAIFDIERTKYNTYRDELINLENKLNRLKISKQKYKL